MADVVGLVVQCRMASTRLPGKALLPIDGKPLLQRLCGRVALSRLARGLVVATSDRPTNDTLAAACGSWGLPVMRGPEDDLVTRLLRTVETCRFDAFVRVTGDNPLTDPEGIDELIEAFRDTGADVVHNKHRKGYPYGTGAELIATSALRRCSELMTEAGGREDVFGFLKGNPQIFRCVALSAKNGLLRPGYFLTVDFKEDIDLVEHLCRRVGSDDGTPLRAFLAYLDVHPEVVKINQSLHTGFPD